MKNADVLQIFVLSPVAASLAWIDPICLELSYPWSLRSPLCISSHFFIHWKHSLEIVNAAATTSCQCYSPGNAIYLEGNPRMKFQSFFPYGCQLSPCFPWPSQWSACQGLSPHSRSSKVSNSYFLICGSRRELPGTGPVQLPAASGADQASTPPKPEFSFTSHTNAIAALILFPLCSQIPTELFLLLSAIFHSLSLLWGRNPALPGSAQSQNSWFCCF